MTASRKPERQQALQDGRRTLTVEQAGELLGISRGLAYVGVANGSIPSIRVGRRILVPTARLLALLGDPRTGPSNLMSADAEIARGRPPVELRRTV